MTGSAALSSLHDALSDLGDIFDSSAELAPQSRGLAASVERHLKEYFAAHESGLPAAGLYGRILQEIERPLISVALLECQGNQLRAAELLGLNRNTLRKKIRDLGLEPRRGRRSLALHASKKALNEP